MSVVIDTETMYHRVQGNGYDFRVRWNLEGKYLLHFVVSEVLASCWYDKWKVKHDELLYTIAGADSSADSTPDFDKAERYVTGTIKADGCSNVTFNRDCATHLCGRPAWQGHVDLMRYLWQRAAELVVVDSVGHNSSLT